MTSQSTHQENTDVSDPLVTNDTAFNQLESEKPSVIDNSHEDSDDCPNQETTHGKSTNKVITERDFDELGTFDNTGNSKADINEAKQTPQNPLDDDQHVAVPSVESNISRDKENCVEIETQSATDQPDSLAGGNRIVKELLDQRVEAVTTETVFKSEPNDDPIEENASTSVELKTTIEPSCNHAGLKGELEDTGNGEKVVTDRRIVENNDSKDTCFGADAKTTGQDNTTTNHRDVFKDAESRISERSVDKGSTNTDDVAKTKLQSQHDTALTSDTDEVKGLLENCSTGAEHEDDNDIIFSGDDKHNPLRSPAESGLLNLKDESKNIINMNQHENDNTDPGHGALDSGSHNAEDDAKSGVVDRTTKAPDDVRITEEERKGISDSSSNIYENQSANKKLKTEPNPNSSQSVQQDSKQGPISPGTGGESSLQDVQDRPTAEQTNKESEDVNSDSPLGTSVPVNTASVQQKTDALSKLRSAQTYDKHEDKQNYDTLREIAEDRFEYFWLKDDIYSQWFPGDFIVERRKFTSAEQYMMFKKAELFEDWKMMSKIVKTDNPKKIKKYGRQVEGFIEEVWLDHRLTFVKEGNIAKFSQNEFLKEVLFATHPRVFVEASPYDEIWGIGCDKADPDAFDESTWRGLNLLGFIITEVRVELMWMENKLSFQEKTDYIEELRRRFPYYPFMSTYPDQADETIRQEYEVKADNSSNRPTSDVTASSQAILSSECTEDRPQDRRAKADNNSDRPTSDVTASSHSLPSDNRPQGRRRNKNKNNLYKESNVKLDSTMKEKVSSDSSTSCCGWTWNNRDEDVYTKSSTGQTSEQRDNQTKDNKTENIEPGLKPETLSIAVNKDKIESVDESVDSEGLGVKDVGERQATVEKDTDVGPTQVGNISNAELEGKYTESQSNQTGLHDIELEVEGPTTISKGFGNESACISSPANKTKSTRRTRLTENEIDSNMVPLNTDSKVKKQEQTPDDINIPITQSADDKETNSVELSVASVPCDEAETRTDASIKPTENRDDCSPAEDNMSDENTESMQPAENTTIISAQSNETEILSPAATTNYNKTEVSSAPVVADIGLKGDKGFPDKPVPDNLLDSHLVVTKTQTDDQSEGDSQQKINTLMNLFTYDGPTKK